ncbi:putative alpha-L-rhamnosidase C [Aspergillus foveolatus]|uniref:putative alpha-L-rhamnosidase C n=1 Tax=Aspergillus foveolatus TaxID=210207 RepID=UPI003CCDD893
MHINLYSIHRKLAICSNLACCVTLTQPVAYSTDGNHFTAIDSGNFVLSSDGKTPAIMILDYGRNVEKLPTFEVVSRAGDTSVFEISYAECQPALDSYMKLNISTVGTLTLSNVRLLPAVDDYPIAELPGAFRCSDPVLTRIWDVDARTMQLSEFSAGSLPDFWMTTEEGALVESQSPQPFSSDYSPGLTEFELSFSVKPTRNGFGFMVLSDTLGAEIYIFVNIANSSISAHAGSTELDSAPLALAALPASVAVGRWLQSTSWMGHVQSCRMFTDVSVAAFGSTMYRSQLTNKFALKDFLLNTNSLSVSFLASTAGREYIHGSIWLLGSLQMLPGFFSPTAQVQQEQRLTDIPANVTGLIGYSFSLVRAMSRYYEQTGDGAFLSEWAPRAVRLFDWAHSQLLPNGLLNVSDAAIGGDWNYYDPQVVGVVAKFNLAYTYALSESMLFLADAGLNVTKYTQRLCELRSAHSDSYPGFISQEANALAILSNTIPTVRRNRSANGLLATMSQDLGVSAGVLAFSASAVASGWAKKISPYASGYHLKAAFHAKDSESAKHLLNTIWAPVSNPQNVNYTGCFWEVLNEDGTPGLGLGTSFRIGLLQMTITSPHRTKGIVYLLTPLKRDIGEYRVTGGRKNEDGSFTVQSRTFAFQQTA